MSTRLKTLRAGTTKVTVRHPNIDDIVQWEAEEETSGKGRDVALRNLFRAVRQADDGAVVKPFLEISLGTMVTKIGGNGMTISQLDEEDIPAAIADAIVKLDSNEPTYVLRVVELDKLYVMRSPNHNEMSWISDKQNKNDLGISECRKLTQSCCLHGDLALVDSSYPLLYGTFAKILAHFGGLTSQIEVGEA